MIETDGVPAAALAHEPDYDRVEAIAHDLDLRQPNKEALEAVVFKVNEHFVQDEEPAPFEGVADVATGVGKTYLMAGCIEYFAGDGHRNFAVIVPTAAIRDKTVANFTEGHPKSLLSGMQVRPTVITAENFDTADMRAAMDDPEQVKVFIFTVQALTKPTSKIGKRTHDYRESLGTAFYAHLQQADDLFVLADEHHSYFGPAFSEAVRELHPHIALGLTATPHKKSEDQVIFRYPLAAAIADQYVKTPVLVGRKDDRTDDATKVLDGLALLKLKTEAMKPYCQTTGKEPVRPVMLVVCKKVEHADELEELIRSADFADGQYADKVLKVHSKQPDEVLEQLDALEDPDPEGPQIVISVDMLNVGWDVKNVYVILSLRASVSEVLTEQTLGRGLRLPFGEYTGIEILDTLEVLGHERYYDLLKKASVLLNEAFVNRRTHMVERINAQGKKVMQVETATVQPHVVVHGTDENNEAPTGTVVVAPDTPIQAGETAVTSVEEHTAKAADDLEFTQELHPRSDLPALRIPILRMRSLTVPFSLNDITDLDPYEKLGKKIAADPSDFLKRTRISAERVVGPDGLESTRLVTAKAVDPVKSQGVLLPLDDARAALLDRLTGAAIVPRRANERPAAGRLVDAFIGGLGDKAEEVLSAYAERAAAGLIELVTSEHRKYVSKPIYDLVVEIKMFDAVRLSKPDATKDRTGPFKRGRPYEGYKRSMYAQDWFDSEPERAVANLIDDADEIAYWTRLQRGDLPILWRASGEYHPDLVAVEHDGTRWIIEVKSDKELKTESVQAKREQAKTWTNFVNSDEQVDVTWKYLLVAEADIKTAKGSWPALRQVGV